MIWVDVFGETFLVTAEFVPLQPRPSAAHRAGATTTTATPNVWLLWYQTEVPWSLLRLWPCPWYCSSCYWLTMAIIVDVSIDSSCKSTQVILHLPIVTGLIKPGFGAQNYIQRYKQWLYCSFLVYYAEELKFTASTCLFIIYGCITLNSRAAFFMRVMILHVAVIGVVGGLNKGA